MPIYFGYPVQAGQGDFHRCSAVMEQVEFAEIPLNMKVLSWDLRAELSTISRNIGK